jgi:branched-subunit amino acid ABC-type transport system permease component
MFAGLLAALGGVLLGASSNLHPFNLSLGAMLPAFVAALIGGLTSERRALQGAALVGLVIGIVPTFGGVGKQPGAPQVALTVLALVVMSMRGQRISAGDVRSGL